nr:MAG TPA: hypothetical protein [Caudoviricetes sp.]
MKNSKTVSKKFVIAKLSCENVQQSYIDSNIV